MHENHSRSRIGLSNQGHFGQAFNDVLGEIATQQTHASHKKKTRVFDWSAFFFSFRVCVKSGFEKTKLTMFERYLSLHVECQSRYTNAYSE
jgi:fructose-1,6-bisphosphatase